jgi:hypothetical protein
MIERPNEKVYLHGPIIKCPHDAKKKIIIIIIIIIKINKIKS